MSNGYDKTVAQSRAHEFRKDFLDSNNWIGASAAPPSAPYPTPRKCDGGSPALDVVSETIRYVARLVLNALLLLHGALTFLLRFTSRHAL